MFKKKIKNPGSFFRLSFRPSSSYFFSLFRCNTDQKFLGRQGTDYRFPRFYPPEKKHTRVIHLPSLSRPYRHDHGLHDVQAFSRRATPPSWMAFLMVTFFRPSSVVFQLRRGPEPLIFPTWPQPFFSSLGWGIRAEAPDIFPIGFTSLFLGVSWPIINSSIICPVCYPVDLSNGVVYGLV